MAKPHTITVLDTLGKESSFTVKAKGIETAAIKACRLVCQKKAAPRRTTGEEGEPGWFYPEAKWGFPFAGNSFHVGPLDGE